MDSNCVGTLQHQAPGGGDRLIAVMNDTRILDDSLRVTISDDGGDTWRRGQGLFPGEYRACTEIVDLGGGRAVAAMMAGPIWGTEDAGETWSVWSEWPGPPRDVNVARTYWAWLGPDGRLYLGLYDNSGHHAEWDLRTTVPIGPVAEESGPADEASQSLRVRPNPTGGRVTIELTTEQPARVLLTVVDARGRTAVEIYDGDIRGSTEFAVDTSTLASGVYMVYARVKGGSVATAPFTIVR